MLNLNNISISSDINLLLQDTMPSTNDYLLAEIKNNPNLPVKTVIITEQQIKGRGQNQKTWLSPYGKNIYLSYYWQFVPHKAVSGLSLVVALAVNSALKKLGVSHIQLKWPNDIYYLDKKLAGILIESIIAKDKSVKVVVGVGINVNYAAELATNLGEDKYIYLEKILAIPVDRNLLISILIRELFIYMGLFVQYDFSYFKSAWEKLDLLQNKTITVKVTSTADLIEGVMVGVDLQGKLLLKTANNGLLSIASGSIVNF